MKFKAGTCALLLTTLFVGVASAQEAEFFDNEASSETHRCGTEVEFFADEAKAFAAAKKTGKLVYVLHLSGNLKNETFT